MSLAMAAQPAAPDARLCEPARLADAGADLPAPWRARLDDLLRATAEPGRPWSCSGAQLRLRVLEDGQALLEVEDRAGRTVSRSVSTPDDLVPIGEAVLAQPAQETAGAPASPPGPSRSPPPTVDRGRRGAGAVRGAAAPPAYPHLELDGRLSTRYTGPTSALWGGALIGARVIVDAWAAGIWARFDAPAWLLEPVPADFSMSEIVLGLGIERRWRLEPWELRVALHPALAVVSMEGGDESDLSAGGKIDGRLGVAVAAGWRLSPAWTLLLGVDGELAPAAIDGSDDRRIEPALPPVPAYTLGMSLGLGVALP